MSSDRKQTLLIFGIGVLFAFSIISRWFVPSSTIHSSSDHEHASPTLSTVFSSGKISFNGSIKGTLESKSLYVGENGFIDGKVEADEAVILGRIKGTLKGNKVRLAASSRIEGDTYHQVIAIEDGAIYEGSIQRIKST